MRSTSEYGEPFCLSLQNQLDSKERPLISSVMWRTLRVYILLYNEVEGGQCPS